MKNYICPITNQQCDDECCTSAEHCNIDNKELKDDVLKLGNEDVPKLGYDVGKLVLSDEERDNLICNCGESFIQHAFIYHRIGYNKAKETLYTEEQVREAMKYASEITNNKMKYMEDYIQSLKQTKKD